MNNTDDKKMNCPCNPGTEYSKCCQIIHEDIREAKTAQQLMRSRYSAFAFGMGDFLMASHHASTRRKVDKKELVKWAKSMKWLKLDVLGKTKGLENDLKGTVKFRALYKDGWQVKSIDENSVFCKENEIWYYVSELLGDT